MKSTKWTIQGCEGLTLSPQPSLSMIEVWCKVWQDGKRAPERDGYFYRRSLIPLKKQCHQE